MRIRVRSGILVSAMMAVLALGAGCGDNGSSGSNDNGGAQPTRTTTPGAPTVTPTVAPTPAATATAGETEDRNVNLDFAATAALLGFQVGVAYPTAKGSFKGSADQVQCTTTASGVFTKNDQDNGTMILSLASATDLSFPLTIACVFEEAAGEDIAAGDRTITVQEVTASNGTVGDPTTLQPSVSLP